MVAPTRRAAPVTSAVLPASTLLGAGSVSAASGSARTMDADYDPIGRALNASGAEPRRAASQRGRRGVDPRRAGRLRRLALFRALHGARALCAGTRLLQRR